MKRKLRMGMIGGGQDAFIGSVHRMAANMDGLIELCCGALSINPEIAISSGRALFLPEERIYLNYEEMIEKESQRGVDTRLDFITIVTPNFAHFAPAMLALEKGFNVVIEKPITLSLKEAKLLGEKVKETGLLLCLAHAYSGYPMVKQAREMISQNLLGEIRKIWVEYPQGWLSKLVESQGNQQALWRTDPAKSGKSGCMGDIGVHAAHLAEYVSGLKITHVCADLNSFVKGRKLEDDGNVLLKFENGAAGVLMASQVAAGEANGIRIRIYGEKGGVEWYQEEPEVLTVKWLNAPTQLLKAGNNYPEMLFGQALYNARTPGGHPGGFLEAFANLYRNFATTLSAKSEGRTVSDTEMDFPTVEDGVRGMAFIDTLIASGQSPQKWTVFSV